MGSGCLLVGAFRVVGSWLEVELSFLFLGSLLNFLIASRRLESELETLHSANKRSLNCWQVARRTSHLKLPIVCRGSGLEREVWS